MKPPLFEEVIEVSKKDIRKLKELRRRVLKESGGHGHHIGFVLVNMLIWSNKKMEIETEKINDKISFLNFRFEI